MKVITSFTLGPDLEIIAEESYEYVGPVAMAKGSEGGGQYENLERLYGIQADQAQELMGIARTTVFPGYKKLMSEAQGYGSEANQNLAATNAAADSRAATGSAKADLEENLRSMGIDPSDSRYASTFAKMATQGGANEAAAATGARDRREQMGFARLQDATSLGMGTPTQATVAANSAANSASTAGNLQMQQQTNTSNSIGNTVRAGVDIYGKLADGGPVGIKRVKSYAKGGWVQHAAAGGLMGSIARFTPPPPSMPSGPSATDNIMSGASLATSAGGKKLIGDTASLAGDMSGNTYLSAAGKGIANPQGVQPAIDVYRQAATASIDKAMPAAIPESGATLATAGGEAAAAGATDAATIAAAEAAAAETAAVAGAGEAAAGLSAGAMAGAAIPYVGAGIALYGIGNAAGWWADGGAVTPGSRGKSGEVDGPGGPKDDLIHAKIPVGAYVLPIGTVLKYGVAKLEKMNDEGESSFADGGKVELADAMVSDDEFVISPAAAKRLGLHRLEKMRQEGLQYEKQLGIGR